MKIPAVICDLDGTLCNNDHRRHLVECARPDFNAFHDLMGDDKPKSNVLWLLRQFNQQWLTRPTLLFVTGRPESYRKQVMTWLALVCDLHPHDDDLIMRADSDQCQDDELKWKIWKFIIEPAYDVRLVLDDRQRVVDMWRRAGLECWQVAAGDF